MRRAWAMAKGGLAALALAAALGTVPAAPAVAQEEGRPAANAPPRKVIRTKRLRVPADLFERDAVVFKRVRVDAGGSIRADGHNLELYGLELVRRNRICAPEGVRWACGQRACEGCWKDNLLAVASSRRRPRRKPSAGSATPT